MRQAGLVSQAGSVCWDLAMPVKHNKNQLCNSVEKSQASFIFIYFFPASWDPTIAMLGFRLDKLKI